MKKFYLICVGVIIFDRVTKYLVTSSMNLGETIPLIQDVFHFTHVRNTGAAFGILAGQRLFFILITLAVVVMLLLYASQVKDNRLLQIAFGLQLGGAVGNLIDRLMHGTVIDFFDFRVINFPVFNIADSAIVIGVSLFAIDVLLEWKKERYEA